MASIPAVSAPPVSGAFEELAKTVLSATTLTITFSGIDTSNRIFRLTIAAIKGPVVAGTVSMRINNDSGANYDAQALSGAGGSVSGVRNVGSLSIALSFASANENDPFTAEIVIAKQQAGNEAMVLSSAVHPNNSADLVTQNQGAIWNNTADLINRIDVIFGGTGADVGTVALLEGDNTV